MLILLNAVISYVYIFMIEKNFVKRFSSGGGGGGSVDIWVFIIPNPFLNCYISTNFFLVVLLLYKVQGSNNFLW